VFGDNLDRIGRGGAAALRDHPQSIGFITKKTPSHRPAAYFFPDEYRPVFDKEVIHLCRTISRNPDKTYLISPVGSGLANAYGIFQQVIDGPLQQALGQFSNVVILWESSTNISQ
tara:strand:- start:2175 stop:2519 length:345 start_codon:yes stop_codon:yes gene_type:complete